MLITSSANPRVKAVAALADKRQRDAAGGQFWLEGIAYVAAAVASGFQLDELWHVGQVPLVAANTTVETTVAVLAKITGKSNPQPVLGVLRQRWLPLPGALSGLWLALDRPRDPGNLGSIIRTAHAAAAGGLILIGEATDPYAPECVRATAGSLAAVPLVRCSEADFVAWSAGRDVIGTAGDASLDYRSASSRHDSVLLMGNESEGLATALRAAASRLVRIPMPGGSESLNLAVAAGVMLFELLRQRQ